jgi:cytochrome b561
MNQRSAQIPNRTAWTYSLTAALLHWFIALLLAIMVGLGWYMTSIEKQTGSAWFFDLHKSLGILVFLAILFRLAWRIFHRPEPLPKSVPPWQARLSTVTQGLLYACMLVMPLTGMAGALFSKDGLAFFGSTVGPIGADHDLSEKLFSVHSATAWILVVLVGLHIAGALKHRLLDRDEVFQRMWLWS